MEKPKLVLLAGNAITAEHLARMYKALTGREATEEEVDQARVALRDARGRPAEPEMEGDR